MNTLQKYYEKIKEDDEKKRAFVEAMRAGKAEDFLRESGCDVTAEELEEFLAGTARQEEPLELSDESRAAAPYIPRRVTAPMAPADARIPASATAARKPGPHAGRSHEMRGRRETRRSRRVH